MTTLKTLLVQSRLAWKDPESNRERLGRMLDEAEDAFDLAVLPETFTTGFLGDADLEGEGMDGPTVAWMRERAARHACALAGSAIITEHGKRYNRLLFVTPDGEVRHYDKRHRFAFGGESQKYAAGGQRVIVDFHGWRINLQVCYDLRFPVWCRNRGDYDLMLLVANWPAARVRHWLSLLEARAIENQSYVIGVNRVGEDGNGLQYPGRSVVNDPLGTCVADLGADEASRLVELDLARVSGARAEFPFQADADPFEML
jgi:predicted amidohydrolase